MVVSGVCEVFLCVFQTSCDRHRCYAKGGKERSTTSYVVVVDGVLHCVIFAVFHV